MTDDRSSVFVWKEGDIIILKPTIKKGQLFTQGGPGSGFKGHRGRPGRVGGSSSEDFAYFIGNKGELVSVPPESTHAVFLRNNPSSFGFSPKETKDINAFNLFDFIQSKGITRVRGFKDGGEVVIDLVETPDIEELQDIISSIPEITNDSKVTVTWKGNKSNFINFTPEELFFSNKIYSRGGVWVLQNNRIFTQGGTGSGYHGHHGRPGKVGGSSKSRSFPVDRTLEDVLDEQDRLNDEVEKEIKAKPDHRKRVEDIVKRIGYPVDRVNSTEEEGYTFLVDNQIFRAGGQYDPKTGQITMYNVDQETDPNLEGMLAHEIQHSRFHEFRQESQKQFVEVNRAIKNKAQKNWPVNADRSLKDKFKDKYWAYDIDYTYLSTGTENWRTLRRTDGVSSYSKVYWSQYENTRSPWDFNSAVDETLAEIARIDVGSGRTGDNPEISLIWQELYKKVKRNTKQNKLFLFGSGHFGHKGRPGKVGGSSKSSSARFTDTDPISGKKTKVVFSEEEKETIDRIVSGVQEFYNIESPTFIAGNVSGGEFGHHGKIKGEHYIWISTDKIRGAKEQGKYDVKEWMGVADDSYESLLSHVVAHEIGHAWWDSHSVKSKELVRLPSGNKGIVETNPILLDWRDNIYPRNKSSFSGYSRYYGSYKEAFMDEFSKYANGDPMSNDVESWFMENVK